MSTDLHETAQDNSTGPRNVADVLAEGIARMPTRSPLTQEQIEQREAEAEQRQEVARRQGNFAHFLQQCGAEAAKNYTFKAYQVPEDVPYQQRCKDAVLEWAKGGKDTLAETRSLILHGPVGTGKDHLGIAACRGLCLTHGYKVGFLAVQDWFGRIRDAMDDNESERDILREVSAPDVLLISDPLPPFGSLTQHQATMFYRLVERRSSLRKHNIVTINVRDDDEAYERLGAPTWNRLIEDALVVHCYWPSHRQPRQRIVFEEGKK